MQDVLRESLRQLWHFKGNRYWEVVREAEKRKLDARSAPSSDFEHFLRPPTDRTR